MNKINKAIMLKQAKSMLRVLAVEERIYPGIHEVLGADSLSPDYTEQDLREILSDLKSNSGEDFHELERGEWSNFIQNLSYISKAIQNYKKDIPWWWKILI